MLRASRLGPVSYLRRWLHQVKDVIGLGSQATLKEGLVKKTKEKVAIKVYEVRDITSSFAPTSDCAELSYLPSAQKAHREFSEEEVLREASLALW